MSYYVVGLSLNTFNEAWLVSAANAEGITVNGFVTLAVCEYCNAHGLKVRKPRVHKSHEKAFHVSMAVRAIFLPEDYRGPLTLLQLQKNCIVSFALKLAVLSRLEKGKYAKPENNVRDRSNTGTESDDASDSGAPEPSAVDGTD